MKTINDYAELVKEKHALNKTIAPVETDLTDASRGYHIGEQFIYDGELNKAKTEIAQHDALVLNTNYEPADDLTTQIKNAGGGTGTDPRLDVFENNIAPVETDETDASRPYQVREQLILNNILYDVIAPISEHDVITTTGSGANIAPADPISSQFQTLTNQVKDMNNVYGSKNLLPNNVTSQTVSGVTYTKNADGTITINGTRTTAGGITISEFSLEAGKKYKYSIGNPFNLSNTAGSNIQGYDGTAWVALGNIFGTETEAEFESNSAYSKYRVNINSNNGVTFSNLTIKPMIRLASITDDTYEPYAKTNQQLTEDTTALLDNLEVNGAVNMLPNNATTQTVNGITFTVNDDGSVTANGTSTGYTSLVIAQHGQASFFDDFIGKPIKLSGCPSGGASNTYKLRFDYASGNYVDDVGEGVIITPTAGNSNTWYVEIGISGGVTVSNLTFKPMITVPSYNGDYVPYAKSNRELTEELNNRLPLLIDSGTIPENSSKTISIAESSSALYRLTLGSIGADSCGRIVIFGKHPSVANIRYATFDCVDINASYAAVISVSGSSLTITSATNSNCMYTLEKIRA